MINKKCIAELKLDVLLAEECGFDKQFLLWLRKNLRDPVVFEVFSIMASSIMDEDLATIRSGIVVLDSVTEDNRLSYKLMSDEEKDTHYINILLRHFSEAFYDKFGAIVVNDLFWIYKTCQKTIVCNNCKGHTMLDNVSVVYDVDGSTAIVHCPFCKTEFTRSVNSKRIDALLDAYETVC